MKEKELSKRLSFDEVVKRLEAGETINLRDLNVKDGPKFVEHFRRRRADCYRLMKQFEGVGI